MPETNGVPLERIDRLFDAKFGLEAPCAVPAEPPAEPTRESCQSALLLSLALWVSLLQLHPTRRGFLPPATRESGGRLAPPWAPPKERIGAGLAEAADGDSPGGAPGGHGEHPATPPLRSPSRQGWESDGILSESGISDDGLISLPLSVPVSLFPPLSPSRLSEPCLSCRCLEKTRTS